MKNLYQYFSAQKYLADIFKEKRVRNPRYSARAWAKSLHLKSHTPLLAILAGKKPVPLSLYKDLVDNLELTKEEGYYLLNLIYLENSTDQFSRAMLLERIEFIQKQKNLRMKELENLEILSDPFYAQLVEMTDLREAKTDPDGIAKISRIEKSPAEILSAINALVDHGLLKREGETLRKSQSHVTNVSDLANLGSQTYLKNSALLAAQEIAKQAVGTREFNGYALNIRKRDVAKMKERIRSFIKDFIVEFEAESGGGDTTYQFNIQLFDLLKMD